MELRPADPATAAGGRQLLAAANDVADLHQDLVVVAIGADPAAIVAQQDQIAEAADLVAGVGDDAAFGRPHRGARREGDVDTVVVQAALLGAEAGDHPAFGRPGELAAAALGWLGNGGGLPRRFMRRPRRGIAGAHVGCLGGGCRRRCRGARRRRRCRRGRWRRGRQAQALADPDLVGRRDRVGPDQCAQRDLLLAGDGMHGLAGRHVVVAHGRDLQRVAGPEFIGRRQFVGSDQVAQGDAGAARHLVEGVAGADDVARLEDRRLAAAGADGRRRGGGAWLAVRHRGIGGAGGLVFHRRRRVARAAGDNGRHHEQAGDRTGQSMRIPGSHGGTLVSPSAGINRRCGRSLRPAARTGHRATVRTAARRHGASPWSASA